MRGQDLFKLLQFIEQSEHSINVMDSAFSSHMERWRVLSSMDAPLIASVFDA
jgi:hypothetical protein